MSDFPGAIQTFADESNADVDNIGGTILDGDKQTVLYETVEALQVTVGPNTDTDASLSHEGRLQALEGAGTPLANPMTTVGDVIRGTTAGAPQRLGIGTTAQVLTVVAGLPAWADAATGDSSTITTPGDLEYGAVSSGNPTRLAIGNTADILTVVAGLPAWVPAPYIADPAGAPAGAVLIKNASSVWTYLTPSSTTGDVLTSQGLGAAPIWDAVPAQVPGSDIPAPGGERVGAILQWNGTIYDKVLPGTAGQVLTAHGDNNVVGSLLTWATPSSGATNPLTTLSDLWVAGVGGAPGRLGIGTTGYVLTVVSGAPAWVAPAWVNPMTTLDDVIIGGASGVAARLAKGSNGQVLTISSSGHVVWQNSASGFADPETTIGDLIHRNASNVTARLPIGSTGQVLTVVSGVPAWATAAGGYTDPLTTRGDLVVRGASTTGRLALGTSGFVLTSDGTDAVWAAATGGGAAGSRLARTTDGLIFYQNFADLADVTLPTSAGPNGWLVTAQDAGTWKLIGGLLVCTSAGGYDHCRNLTPNVLNAVYETRINLNGGANKAGLILGVVSGADTGLITFYQNNAWEINARSGGGWGASTSGSGNTVLTNQWSSQRLKMHVVSTNPTIDYYVNRRLVVAPFTFTGGSAGGIGLACGTNATLFKDFAVFTDTVFTVAGLSGTQAFRLRDAGGEVVGASGTQSGGSATLDLATLVDCPFTGSIEVHTSTAFSSLITGGRYPAEGVAGDLYGGDVWTYT